jgi:hypothetical protein
MWKNAGKADKPQMKNIGYKTACTNGLPDDEHMIIETSRRHEELNLVFVVPCIFKYSIKQQTRCTINLLFIALSRRHRSTCFGHCCAHHQDPPPTAFAATVYRMIAGLNVLQAVVGLLVNRIVN